MSTNRNTARLLALMVAAAATVSRGADKPKPPPTMPLTEVELRSVISKSLGFLAKEGDDWMAAKSCNGCHHLPGLPGLLWSHREAMQRGFAIDQAKFDEWLSWSTDSMKGKKGAVTEASLITLAVPDKAPPQLIQRITSSQKPDGTWDPRDILLTMQKHGSPDGDANLVRLCLAALSASPATAKEAEAAQAKAGAVLQKDNPPSSMESLVFRALYARRFGKPEETNALRDQIVKLQRGDGGWSLYFGENQSDTLATGQALYALQPSASDPPTAEAIARAQRWLLRIQRPDGSWPIDLTHVSMNDRSAPDKAGSVKNATGIYTFWGGTWATIGLLQAVPVK